MATSRARRIAGALPRRALQLFLALLMLVGGVLVSVLLLLKTDWGRERLRLTLNDVLADVFEGRIEIERIGSVDLWGVSGVDARIFDPDGRQVIDAHGLRAVASVPARSTRSRGSSGLPPATARRATSRRAPSTSRGAPSSPPGARPPRR